MSTYKRRRSAPNTYRLNVQKGDPLNRSFNKMSPGPRLRLSDPSKSNKGSDKNLKGYQMKRRSFCIENEEDKDGLLDNDHTKGTE